LIAVGRSDEAASTAGRAAELAVEAAEANNVARQRR
jgi:hypothetical protein